jgi:hypothetical protein
VPVAVVVAAVRVPVAGTVFVGTTPVKTGTGGGNPVLPAAVADGVVSVVGGGPPPVSERGGSSFLFEPMARTTATARPPPSTAASKPITASDMPFLRGGAVGGAYEAP